VFTLTKEVGDQSNRDEGTEHDVRLVVPSKDTAEALDAPNQSLDLIALLVKVDVVLPRIKPVRLRWYDRLKPELAFDSTDPILGIYPQWGCVPDGVPALEVRPKRENAVGTICG